MCNSRDISPRGMLAERPRLGVGGDALETLQIGAYRLRILDDRLSVFRRPGLCVRLGLRESRPVLSVLGAAQISEVTVARRQLRGPEIKRRHSARPWSVQVLGPDRKPLDRALRFRTSREAETCADLIKRFSSAPLGSG